MQPSEQRAALTLCLLAAFADGNNDDRERDALKRAAASFGGDVDLTAVYEDVLLRKPDVATVAASFTGPGHKQLAYEMAVRHLQCRRRDVRRRACVPRAPRAGAGTAVGAGGHARGPGQPHGQRLARKRRARRRARRGGPGVRRRPRQDDPQLFDPQRRARAAAAVAGIDGDHPVADAHGLSHRQVAWLRARQRSHQGLAGHRSASA